MLDKFNNWCHGRVCRTCKYRGTSSTLECFDLFIKHNSKKDKSKKSKELERIENKIDAIIKYFGISVD